MVFRRFVEVGRVALINSGEDKGKLAVIVDVIDATRVLVDGPSTGVARQAVNYKNISLTDFKIDIVFGMRTGKVQKAFDAADIKAKWDATAWAKTLSRREKRAQLSDFDRFVVKVTKQKRNRKVAGELKKLQKK